MTNSVHALKSPISGPVLQALHFKLAAAFDPEVLDVINESHLHAVPAGSEQHFKVVIVSDRFESESRLSRHRSVHAVLAEEITGGVHALSIDAFTPMEWRERGGATLSSPRCRGGGSRNSVQGRAS